MTRRRLKRRDPITERPDEFGQRDQQAPQVRSPWLTTAEACDYLRYTGKHRLRSLYRFLQLKGIPTARRSVRRVLVARADLDRALGAGHRKVS